MGDHRATIKIEFSMYGYTEKADMWINWSAPDYTGVDERVIEFFAESVEKFRTQLAFDEEERERKKEAEIAKADWTDGTWVPPSVDAEEAK